MVAPFARSTPIVGPWASKLTLLFASVALCLPRYASATPNSKRSDEASPVPDSDRKHAIGTSLFMLANLVPMDYPPAYYQLNYEYRLTPRDVFSVEALTWRYHAPLGIPFGKHYEDPEENFPGYVQAYGVALVYKRFMWRGLYGAVHAANMHQTYIDDEGEGIQSGYQLFMTFRAGYRFQFLEQRFFLEPSLAMTAWPINTNLPASFAAQEDKWPRVFLVEPGLHSGVAF